jgi:hypothetical protein
MGLVDAALIAVSHGRPAALAPRPANACKRVRCKPDAVRSPKPRCLIPRFDGAIHSLEWKEALWDKFVTGAPRPRTPSEQQYSDRKLRRGAEPGARHQSEDGREVAEAGRRSRIEDRAEGAALDRSQRGGEEAVIVAFRRTRCCRWTTVSMPCSQRSRISRGLRCIAACSDMASRGFRTWTATSRRSSVQAVPDRVLSHRHRRASDGRGQALSLRSY